MKTQTYITHPPCLIPSFLLVFRGKNTRQGYEAIRLRCYDNDVSFVQALLIVPWSSRKKVLGNPPILFRFGQYLQYRSCVIYAVGLRSSVDAKWRSWTRRMISTASGCSVSWATFRSAILIKGKVRVSIKSQANSFNVSLLVRRSGIAL